MTTPKDLAARLRALERGCRAAQRYAKLFALEAMWDEHAETAREAAALLEGLEKLTQQEDLPAEAAKVLRENLWNLYGADPSTEKEQG